MLENVSLRYSAVAILVFILVSLSIAVVDVRGSDQYWYLADTETLILGQSPETNTRFPGMILRQNTGNPVTYFLHNGPLLHFNAFIGKFLGAFQAWKFTNITMLVMTAVITGLIAATLAGNTCGYLAFSLYLISPIVIWQASNLLIEPALAVLISALMLIHVRGAKNGVADTAICILFFTGILLHPLFVPLALVYLLNLFFFEKRYWGAGALIVAVAIAHYYKKIWFPSSFQPDMISIITSAIPKTTNMLWHLTDVSNSLTVELLWLKLIDAVRQQFLNFPLMPLYWLNNFGIFAFFYLLFKGGKSVKIQRFLWFGFFVLGLYAAIAVLMQNQPRYQMIIVPVTIISLVLVLYQLKWNSQKRLAALVVISGLFLVDSVLLAKVHSDAIAQVQERRELNRNFSSFSDDTKVVLMVTSIADYLRIVYTLRPRPVLIIHTGLLEEHKQIASLELFQPDLIISEEEFDLLPVTTLSEMPKIARPETTKTMNVYRVQWEKKK